MPSEEQEKKKPHDTQKGTEQTAKIRNRILVLSGKGGVGKSTVAANLAVALAATGKKVGLLDVDIHGPSIPGLLGLSGPVHQLPGPTPDTARLQPVTGPGNLLVMSIGFLLDNPDTAVIWRGPMKYNVIRQFITDTDWGDLDYLVVDSPPGTGDEPLSVAQLLDSPSHALVVTTPQQISVADVRRCVTFCRQLELPVLGVVENMSGFACPHCGEVTDIFKSGGGEAMARAMDVRFLGKVPLDPGIVDSGEGGRPYVEQFADSPAARSFGAIVKDITDRLA